MYLHITTSDGSKYTSRDKMLDKLMSTEQHTIQMSNFPIEQYQHMTHTHTSHNEKINDDEIQRSLSKLSSHVQIIYSCAIWSGGI